MTLKATIRCARRTTSLADSTISQSTFFRRHSFSSFLGGSAGGGFQATGNATAYSWGVNYDHTFSPTLLTELRFGVAHLRNIANQTDYGSNDAKTLGIRGNGPNGTNNSLQTSGQVAFNLNTFTTPYIGYSASLPWLRAESNIDVANNWTRYWEIMC